MNIEEYLKVNPHVTSGLKRSEIDGIASYVCMSEQLIYRNMDFNIRETYILNRDTEKYELITLHHEYTINAIKDGIDLLREHIPLKHAKSDNNKFIEQVIERINSNYRLLDRSILRYKEPPSSYVPFLDCVVDSSSGNLVSQEKCDQYDFIRLLPITYGQEPSSNTRQVLDACFDHWSSNAPLMKELLIEYLAVIAERNSRETALVIQGDIEDGIADYIQLAEILVPEDHRLYMNMNQMYTKKRMKQISDKTDLIIGTEMSAPFHLGNETLVNTKLFINGMMNPSIYRHSTSDKHTIGGCYIQVTPTPPTFDYVNTSITYRFNQITWNKPDSHISNLFKQWIKETEHAESELLAYIYQNVKPRRPFLSVPDTHTTPYSILYATNSTASLSEESLLVRNAIKQFCQSLHRGYVLRDNSILAIVWLMELFECWKDTMKVSLPEEVSRRTFTTLITKEMEYYGFKPAISEQTGKMKRIRLSSYSLNNSRYVPSKGIFFDTHIQNKIKDGTYSKASNYLKKI